MRSPHAIPYVLVALAATLPAAQRSVPAQDAASFHVTKDGLGPFPPTLIRGISHYPYSREGVVEAYRLYTEQDPPFRGGLVRHWHRGLKPPTSRGIHERWREGGEWHGSGMGVYLTFTGDLGEGAPWRTPPTDATAWGRAAGEQARLLAANEVPLIGLGIWNEPNNTIEWAADFRDFPGFAHEAGLALKAVLAEHGLESLPVGGFDLAGLGAGLDATFGEILRACWDEGRGWAPDLLTWHTYSGLPGDEAEFDIARRARELAQSITGVRPVAVGNTEGNIGLPPKGPSGRFEFDGPGEPALDDHRAGVWYLAQMASLAEAGADWHLLFFMQDGNWQARNRMPGPGKGPGLFTFGSVPKAALIGVKMAILLAQDERVRVVRGSGPAQIGCLASRSGSRGHLLLTHSTRIGPLHKEERAKKALDAAGFSIRTLKPVQAELRRYVAGSLSWEQFARAAGIASKWRGAFEGARRRYVELPRVDREPVVLEITFDEAPRAIRRCWVLDRGHGIPQDDPDFVAAVRAGATPQELVQHPAMRPPEVEPAEVLRFEDGVLRVELQPHTALLLELAYRERAPR